MTEKYNNLTEAFTAWQDAIKQPKKDGKNPMFKSNYVTLEAVQRSIKEAKQEAEIKAGYSCDLDDNDHLVVTVRGYGEELQFRGIKVDGSVGNRGTNALQANGSAMTYARRYALSLAFNIVSDEDDDGNGYQQRPQQQQRTQQRPPQQQQHPNSAQVHKQLLSNAIKLSTNYINRNELTVEAFNAMLSGIGLKPVNKLTDLSNYENRDLSKLSVKIKEALEGAQQ